MTRITLIRWLAALAMVCASGIASAADPYPTKPIRIIVYVGPGTQVDVVSRFVAEKMSELLKQAVVVENMAGAGGMLGIRHVKAAPADGYTVLAGTNTLAVAPVLLATPGFELKDFTAIGGLSQASLVMVGPASQPDKTVAELIGRAKASPGTLSFASGGVGTATYLAGSMFVHQAAVNLLHVPYKGTGAAMPDVIGGRINVMFDAENSTVPHVREGRLRAFAVSSTTRSKSLPEVPTLAEQGLPNYSFSIYNGLMVRADTPREIVQRLSETLHTVLSNPAVIERFRREFGSETLLQSSAEFNEYLRQDSQRIAKLASDMKMEKQ